MSGFGSSWGEERQRRDKALTHDAVVGEEPHLIAPFLGCAVFGLSCVVVDQMSVFDVGVEGRIEVGVGEEGGKFF